MCQNRTYNRAYCAQSIATQDEKCQGNERSSTHATYTTPKGNGILFIRIAFDNFQSTVRVFHTIDLKVYLREAHEAESMRRVIGKNVVCEDVK